MNIEAESHYSNRLPIERNLVDDLLQTEAFTRLRKVSFLGSIDYYNEHNSKNSTWYFSRGDHTRGVLELAIRLIDLINIDNEDRLAVIATAICHDLGHSPFSHSVEKAYRRINPSINHKTVLEFLINNDKFGLRDVLNSYAVDPYRVVNISAGGKDKCSWIFNSPINVDTLDGIFRFLLSFRLPPAFDLHLAVESLAKLYNGGDRLPECDIENFDAFWETKKSFYEFFLREGAYAKFEKAFEELVLSRTNDVLLSDFLKSDADFAEEIGLSPDLGNGHAGQTGALKNEQVPLFEIDKNIVLRSIGDLYRRYRRGTRGNLNESSGLR